MSRHEISAKQPGTTVFVGWDRPLMTFFAQVFRADRDDDEGPELWIGGFYEECTIPEELRAPLAPFADLTDGDLSRLRDDRAADADRAPTDLQRMLRGLITRGPVDG